MGLQFDPDELIAKVDKRAEDELKAAIENIPVSQYKENKWLNEHFEWLKFSAPEDVKWYERLFFLGLKFKCHNCGKHDFETVGIWINPNFSYTNQMMYSDHSIYRCKNCKALRIATS